MTIEMTSDEIRAERAHIIETRLAILVTTRTPTWAQRRIAEEEADNWEDAYRLKVWSEKHLTNEPSDPNIPA